MDWNTVKKYTQKCNNSVENGHSSTNGAKTIAHPPTEKEPQFAPHVILEFNLKWCLVKAKTVKLLATMCTTLG